MQTFIGMILGALLLVCGVYVYDSMQTSSATNGQAAAVNRTIVNWDVAATDWAALKVRAHDDWVRIVVEVSAASPRMDRGRPRRERRRPFRCDVDF